MRHFRDQRAIREAIAEMFHAEGAKVVDQEGVTFALFFETDPFDLPRAPVLVAKINIDRLAADIERRLS
ncbi:hypothetical protein KYK30_20435 [Shinella yambaruensis]|uniref:Uncharacterized protein n=1 Tax=Shinella yambaruensis TaxID=415996 RepID=A0ABQ5ZI32_9HYPH|nr:hypothetical protein [Shinella yambaruensis]MCJ8027038.1 hypothetical protein [Shinella yambaruensis]MCU7982071.1 hypothetical protein [Shinella yambaruensis]GLR51245.1 hypothetical protein GCM10007923_24530 [Shinella yambaruensis]